MTAYIASLRVNLDRVRSEGYSVGITTEPPYVPPVLRQWGRRKYLPNVSAAVQEYTSLANPERGMLSAIAIKHHTTPGSILGRIKRSKQP